MQTYKESKSIKAAAEAKPHWRNKCSGLLALAFFLFRKGKAPNK